MASRKHNPIILYDIASTNGPWSPNTYKIRLALNHKRLPYRVEYIPIHEIESKLKELGIPPSTQNPLFRYTLPVIADTPGEPGGEKIYVVESFNIAVYLDDKYPAPEYPIIFPPGTRVLQSIATNYISRTGLMPVAPLVVPYAATRSDFLDEPGTGYFIRTRSVMFGVDLPKLFDKAQENWKTAEAEWDKLNQVFELNQGGPFITGKQISFADFAFGGIIHMMQKLEGGDMTCWKKIAEWHNGRWAKLWNEIERLEADSSEIA